MGNPLPVSVVAPDLVLDAGIRSTLHGSPDVALVLPDETARVAVVAVDRVDDTALELVGATSRQQHRPKVVVVATEVVPAEARRAIALGVRGLLRRREASTDRLVRTVLTSAAGSCTVPADLLDPLLGAGGDPAAAAETGEAPLWLGPGLSERERAVLHLVSQGMETDEIARELCYSARTVTTVMRDINQRFRLRNRAHAVAYALRGGLL